MHIIHIPGHSIEGGLLEFIFQLCSGMNSFKHTIIYSTGGATRPPNKAILEEKFSKLNVKFILWENGHREINLIRDILAITELNYILKNIEKFDLIHLHSTKAGILGRLLCHLKGFNCIYTPNGASFIEKTYLK